MTLEEAEAIAERLREGGDYIQGPELEYEDAESEKQVIAMAVDGHFTAEEFEAFAVLCRNAERRSGES